MAGKTGKIDTPPKNPHKGDESMNNTLYPRGVDSAKVICVIETKTARGAGTKEQPSRIITEYWDLNGKKLAENDPIFAQEDEK